MAKSLYTSRMENLSVIQEIVVWVPPVLLAITLHEVAHGWVAAYYGDPTARDRGRLTINPIAHIDPVGTILVPALLYFSGGFLFGWAKPVPVNMARLRRPKQHMAVVAAAGPAINLVMAVGWALVLSLALALRSSWPWLSEPLWLMGQVGVSINIVLAVLNLLPIPPLDGFRVVSGFLPDAIAYAGQQWQMLGLGLVILLLVTGLLPAIIGGPVDSLIRFIFSIFVIR